MGKAFASPVRLELLDLLAQAPRSVEELGPRQRSIDREYVAAPPGASCRRPRRSASETASGSRYSVAPEPLRLWLALRDVSAARLAEVQRAADDYLGDAVEAIDRDELIERLARGDVVLVDVRPGEEFAAGHIDGARSIPLDELEQRITELPSDREVIAYCRGPFCVYAHEAVRTLRAASRSARRLEDGVPEWREAARIRGQDEAA